jgi:membrane protein YqaA with SNARE-associated domain
VSVLAFVWGFAEGTVFFLLPDTLLTATALGSLRKALRQSCWALGGALLAGGMMFAFARRDPSAARSLVLQVPFVRAAMVDRADADFQRSGALAVVSGPARGIPYKVYAVRAPENSVRVVPFLLASVPARFLRFLLMVAVARGVSGLLGPARRRAAWVLWATLWALGYGFYWTGVVL